MTDRLASATVAILGFGNQGEAQALNLRSSGARVIVGARQGGRGEAAARALEFPVSAPDEAARQAGERMRIAAAARDRFARFMEDPRR